MRWVGRRVSHRSSAWRACDTAVSDPALLNDFMHDTLGCLIEPGRKAPWLLLENR
jgi:hypothetical protein